MTSDVALYTYRRLDDVRDICLLRIDAGESEIFCTLEHVALSSTIEFDALSYTWGTNDTNHHIICDERHIPGAAESLPQITRIVWEGREAEGLPFLRIELE
jgi:hypothetical protein